MTDELCELENSNLRKCLAWTGQFLTIEQKKVLAAMIRRPLEQGGVTQGDEEARWENSKEWQTTFVRAAELLQQAIKAGGKDSMGRSLDRTNWFAHAEQVANLLMEFDPPEPEASLAQITNAEEASQ